MRSTVKQARAGIAPASPADRRGGRQGAAEVLWAEPANQHGGSARFSSMIFDRQGISDRDTFNFIVLDME